jgi:hypothetical protein
MANENNLSRRDFLRNTSLAGAGAIAGALGSQSKAETTKEGFDTSKILNYNEKMHYRRLGKTGLILSEVGLGGHWKAPWREHQAGWWWGKFIDDENPVVPEDVAKNRTEVVSVCIDAGVNHLDITGLAEAMGFGAALKGRRDKMVVAADDYKACPRHREYCNVESQLRNVENCLKALGSDYIDIWRPQAKMDGTNTDADIEMMIETFEKLKKDGKALHLGVSSHTRPWLQHVIENYAQFEMIIFPCTAKTIDKDKPPVPGNIQESNAREEAGTEQGIFTAAKQKDIGIVTIKPFFGGSLFASNNSAKTGAMGVGSKAENDLARLTLQCVLANDAITAVIPGASTLYEAENAAMASYTRPFGQTPAEKAWMKKEIEEKWAALPEEYQWLRNWEIV